MPHGHGGFGGMPQAEKGDIKALCDALGVTTEATPQQCKKAFYKLARTAHPDKGGDAEKFKKIQNAYDILSNPDKRENYAKYGKEGLDPQMMARRKRAMPKGEPIVFPLKVPLEQLYNGAVRKLNVTRQEICVGCDGKGGKGIKSCAGCHGRGIKIVNRMMGPGRVHRMQVHCEDCQGKGEVVPPSGRCTVCRGRKTVTKEKLIEVHISKGMKHKEKIKFEEEGNQHPGTNAGDIIIMIQQQPHPFFRRSADGPHLVLSKHISLVEALGGFEFTVTHLDGRKILIKSEEGKIYQPNDIKAVKDEGMPVKGAHNVTGHLYVELKVDFPEDNSLDADQITALKAILPGASAENQTVFHYVPKKKPKFADEDMKDEDMVETRTLANVDLKQEKAKYAAHMRQAESQHDEDDEDEGMGGGQQMRCANQ